MSHTAKPVYCPYSSATQAASSTTPLLFHPAAAADAIKTEATHTAGISMHHMPAGLCTSACTLASAYSCTTCHPAGWLCCPGPCRCEGWMLWLGKRGRWPVGINIEGMDHVSLCSADMRAQHSTAIRRHAQRHTPMPAGTSQEACQCLRNQSMPEQRTEQKHVLQLC